jgi:hypothetical protein
MNSFTTTSVRSLVPQRSSLNYLARNKRDNPDKPLVPANFGTPTKYLIEATIFRGRQYNIDNPRFYHELKSFTVNGEGWSYTKK